MSAHHKQKAEHDRILTLAIIHHVKKTGDHPNSETLKWLSNLIDQRIVCSKIIKELRLNLVIHHFQKIDEFDKNSKTMCPLESLKYASEVFLNKDESEKLLLSNLVNATKAVKEIDKEAFLKGFICYDFREL